MMIIIVIRRLIVDIINCKIVVCISLTVNNINLEKISFKKCCNWKYFIIALIFIKRFIKDNILVAM